MSNTPAAGLTAPDGAVALPPLPTELDARRELAREFQIEHLLEHAPITYLARDAEDRVLAIRVVPRAQLDVSAEEVLKPITLAKRLDHPHIARVHGLGTTASFLWYATRYVEGRTLASLLRTVGTMELAACLRIFEQVASALDYAHRRGVSHGALIAERIVVDANEWVLVSDFGARPLLDSGTAGDTSPAADQRALALLIRQCLTGGRPAANANDGLPLHVSQALRRAMSARTADQFPSVLDLVAALDDRAPRGGGAPPEARPTWFGAKPHSARKGGTPVVIADADQDPAAASRAGARVVAVVALVLVFGVGATLISRWSASAPAPAPAPARSAGPVPVTSSSRLGAVPRPDAMAAPAPPPRTAPTPPPPSPPPTAPPSPWRAPVKAAMPVPAPARATIPKPQPAVTPEWRAPAPPAPSAEPALLSINAIPWGSVYIDGRPVGNTPQLDLAVQPGQHRLRVERQGYRPYERMIDLAPGQRLRVTDITLVER